MIDGQNSENEIKVVKNNYSVTLLNLQSKCNVVISHCTDCVTWMFVFSGSASSFSETNYKPSFLPEEELKHLVLKVNILLTKTKLITCQSLEDVFNISHWRDYEVIPVTMPLLYCGFCSSENSSNLSINIWLGLVCNIYKLVLLLNFSINHWVGCSYCWLSVAESNIMHLNFMIIITMLQFS